VRKEPFALRVDNVEIQGLLYVPEAGGSYPGLVISHGIPAGVQDPQDRGYPTLAERFCNEGFLTAIFNFRGCGLSGGNFEILGWTRDLAAVIDHVWHHPEMDRRSLGLLGFSAGGAASVYQGARHRRVTAVVACSCPAVFELFRDRSGTMEFLNRAREIGIIRHKTYPPSLDEWMSGFDEVAPIRWVAEIAPRPLLIVHGSRDELIPVDHAWELYRAAGDPKEIRIIEGAGHKLRPEEEAVSAALDWLRKSAGLRVEGAGIDR